jgi:hypothetical protein
VGDLVVLGIIAVAVVVAVLYGRERARADLAGARSAAEGRAAEAEARQEATADTAARAQAAREVAGEIDHAARTVPPGAPRIGARWGHIRELHPDRDDRPPDPDRDPS